MAKLNTPSYNALIPRDRRIKSIQELYQAINNGGGGGDPEEIEKIKKELQKKVDKVEDKGLSTNDYTNEEKNKLAGLSNYNDAALRELIGGKQDKTLVIQVVFPSSGEVEMIEMLQPNEIAEVSFVDYMNFVIGGLDNTQKCEYCIKFNIGSTIPTLSLPSEIIWAEELILEADTHYVILISYENGRYYGDWKSYSLT